ncbi:MAG TPA: acyltransferase family protein [Polyangiaceae bacterium]|nr:acyltransferase family protein [Polyangiaceae bacterium]
MNEPAAPHGEFRQDIQGLRAIAVLFVVIFHVWPERMAGGFVGVDVFFVISGFLITGLLVREHSARGRIDFAAFYVRRIKRLLPAATLVLLVTAWGTVQYLPIIRWKDTAHQLIGSALYAENWLLVQGAVDYWAQGAPLSPVTHYWSLSIEEQFYFAWPLLIALGGFCALRGRLAARNVLTILAGLIFAVSLWHSIKATSIDAAASYFSTWTRAWELALGALTSLVAPQLSPMLAEMPRRVLGFLALLGLLVSGFWVRETMAFPGWVALAPTLPTALLLLLGPVPGSVSHSQLLSLPPLRQIGDISYSLYLWHWPPLVFFKAHYGYPPTGSDALLVVAGSVIAATISKVALEDPIRKSSIGKRHAVLGFAIGAFCIAASVAGAEVPLKQVERLEQALTTAGGTSVQGALAFLDVSGQKLEPAHGKVSFVPSPLKAKEDLPSVVERGCHLVVGVTEPRPCEVGKSNGSVHIALVGDSHALQWLPTLEAMAEDHDLKITSITKTSCPLTKEMLTVGQKRARRYHECRDWNDNVMKLLKRLKPTLVITSHAAGYEVVDDVSQADTDHRLAVGYARALDELVTAGIPVLALRDTPAMGFDVADCVSSNPLSIEKCAAARDKALPADDVALAKVPPQLSADLSDFMCMREVCPAVVGGVLVYRDTHHLTATYAKTLAPLLWRVLEPRLSR